MSLSIGSSGLEGFALSMGLILALGPQNAFVMRQGLMRSHVFATCLICSLSDAILIGIGILGIGAILSVMEGAEVWISMGAAAFLTGYGILRVRSSNNPAGISIEGEVDGDLFSTLGAALAFKFLNPHVYFDTLLLIGGASSRYLVDEKLAFGIGAVMASFTFFFSLGYGAKNLSGILNKPEAWRIIDLGIACMMFIIAGTIVLPHLLQ